eukprot:2558212-Rhodomonas_salina.1
MPDIAQQTAEVKCVRVVHLCSVVLGQRALDPPPARLDHSAPRRLHLRSRAPRLALAVRARPLQVQ